MANAASAASFTARRMPMTVDTSTCHLRAASAWVISREATSKKIGPARLRGIEGCWHRLGSLCHEDAAGFEVGGVGEAVGAAPEHLEQVVGAFDSAVGGPVAVVPGEDLV